MKRTTKRTLEKKERIRKGALLITAAIAAAGIAAGCGSKDGKDAGKDTISKEQTETGKTDASEPAGTTASEGADEGSKAFSYPVADGGTLSYWLELNANAAANYPSLNDTEFGKKLQENTGITVEFQHPAVGQLQEQFNLLLSNRTLPDIIEYSWLTYAGGPQKAIEDGVVLPLNDVIDSYCPNLKAYLEANPDVDKMIKTDDGTYYCFPFIRGGEKLKTSTGLMLRGDWLDELGLEVPTTMDEWYDVLTAFKTEKNASAPFTYWYSSQGLTDNNPFAYAYGAPRNFYIGDDNKVHFGAVEDGYREYLQTMHKWMSEGLIDVDLATLTNDQVSAKITNGSAGASFGWCGSSLGTWTSAGRATEEDFTLVSAPYPTVEKGDKPEFGQKDNDFVNMGCAVITTSCENVELAARLLDYAYSDEGHMLFNFGIEGTSYTMENGEPVYTDLILNNPDLSITHAMSGYIRANYNGPFVQDEAYADQYYVLDEQKEALAVWSDTNADKHIIPPVTPTVEESKEQAQIMNEINTYRDEMTLKFILGNRSFDEWDDYVETIREMNLDRVLEIQNAALERYQAR